MYLRILNRLLAIPRHKLALGAFLIPLLIRSIPEVLAGPYPVGWDIIAYYIPNSLDLVSGSMNVWGIITSPPLMYAIIVPALLLTKDSLVWIFKILGPLLFGLLSWSIFTFCQRRLYWPSKKAFYAVLFISAYFITLRIAWDAYQAELGLALLLLAESIVGKIGSTRSEIGKTSLLSLAVLSNQLVGLLVVGIQLARLVKSSTWARPRHASLQFPPVALFLLILYATMQTPLAPGLAVAGPGFSLASLLDATSFLLYAYVFVTPLLLVGIGLRERHVFAPWVLVCAVGLILSVLPGHVFQDIGYRWALLLSVPVLIVAFEGYSKLQAHGASGSKTWTGLVRVMVIVGLASSATLFAVLPAQSAFPLYTAFPLYLPTSMVQSASLRFCERGAGHALDQCKYKLGQCNNHTTSLLRLGTSLPVAGEAHRELLPLFSNISDRRGWNLLARVYRMVVQRNWMVPGFFSHQRETASNLWGSGRLPVPIG